MTVCDPPQDERLDGAGALRAALAGRAAAGAGLLADDPQRVLAAAQRAAGLARVQWASDVGVGDRVEVVPLAGGSSPGGGGQEPPGVEVRGSWCWPVAAHLGHLFSVVRDVRVTLCSVAEAYMCAAGPVHNQSLSLVS